MKRPNRAPWRHPARRNSAGAVAVETAIVFPFVLMLTFGIIEFSLYFFVRHTVESMDRDAARQAASLAKVGNGTAGDSNLEYWETVANDVSAKTSGQILGLATPQKMIIYAACPGHSFEFVGSSGNETPQEKCANTPSQISLDGKDATCGSVAKCIELNWVAATKKFTYSSGSWTPAAQAACLETNDVLVAGGGTSGASQVAMPDKVGVYIRYDYQWITGMIAPFLPESEIYALSIAQLEPLGAGSCEATAP